MIQVPTREWRGQITRHGNGVEAPRNPATERQVTFLRKLQDERAHGWEPHIFDAFAADRRACSAAIDELLRLPRKQRPLSQDVTEGMYRTQDGVIYKVQRAVHGSGNLYAKRLEQLAEPRELRTKTVTHEFIYAPGAVHRLRASDKMSLEDAKAWGALYGTCCCCGATLTNETSIAAGIGPICGSRFR